MSPVRIIGGLTFVVTYLAFTLAIFTATSFDSRTVTIAGRLAMWATLTLFYGGIGALIASEMDD